MAAETGFFIVALADLFGLGGRDAGHIELLTDVFVFCI